MIICPLTTDECSKLLVPRPQECFLMTALPENTSQKLSEVWTSIKDTCSSLFFDVITAENISDSTDFLCKICKTIRSVSFGISLYLAEFDISAVSNIFLETGLMLGFGKKVYLIMEQGNKIPSNLSRTDCILFNSMNDLNNKLRKKIESLLELPRYYVNTVGDIALEAKDYERAARYYTEAILISKDTEAESKLKDILTILRRKRGGTGLEKRLKQDIDVFLRNLQIASSLRVRLSGYGNHVKNKAI